MRERSREESQAMLKRKRRRKRRFSYSRKKHKQNMESSSTPTRREISPIPEYSSDTESDLNDLVFFDSGDKDNDDDLEENLRKRNEVSLSYITEEELRQRDRRAKTRSRFILRIISPIILALNVLMVLFFVIIENNVNVYFYFTVAGVRNSELPVLFMVIVAIATSSVPAVIVVWGNDCKNKMLLIIFSGTGKVLLSGKYPYGLPLLQISISIVWIPKISKKTIL